MNTKENGKVVWGGDSIGARLLLAYWRRFPAHKGKQRLSRWIIKWMFRNEFRVRTAWGSRIMIDPNDYIGNRIGFTGGYEPKSVALAARIMAKGGVFVDLGCNFGLYSMVAGAAPGVECVAIDASFAALNKFANNLKLNPGVHATIVASAVSSERALNWFATPEHNNLGATRITEKRTNGDAQGFWMAGTDLESILRQTVTGRVRLLKADLEGFELTVFRNFDFDGRFRPENILVECDPTCFKNARECFEYLKQKGYVARNIEGTAVDSCDLLPELNVWFEDGRK